MGFRSSGFLGTFLLLELLLVPALPAAPVTLELIPSTTRIQICQGGHVEIAFSIHNPDLKEVAGLQAFLRYPAELFEPVSYVKRDLKGFSVTNGPAPFGQGYQGCDLAPADPWSDGKGADVVSVVASAYGEPGAGPLKASEATLGAFVFRLLPGVAATAAAVFALELDSCSSSLQRGPALYDSAGGSLELAFVRPQVSLELAGGVRVSNLTCAADPDGTGVLLAWDLPTGVGFDGLNIYRGGALIRAFVPPSVRSLSDDEAPVSRLLYEVVAMVRGREEACRAACEIDLAGGAVPFIRGDANGDGRRNISDPVVVLGYLFLGGPLKCPDAADFDDNAALDLTDAVNLLGYLFQEGPAPRPPFPDPGLDPTPDSLGCARA